MLQVGKCRLPYLLRKLGWTQRDLATKVNKKEQLISDYAHNRKVMSIRTAKIICDALPNCNRIDDLYDWEREPTANE